MVATMASKSVLRAAAAELAVTETDVDYFPSYELINSPAVKGCFFEPNQRQVSTAGVKFVMDNFFRSLAGKFGGESPLTVVNADDTKKVVLSKPSSVSKPGVPSVADVVCEEELLEAFKG